MKKIVGEYMSLFNPLYSSKKIEEKMQKLDELNYREKYKLIESIFAISKAVSEEDDSKMCQIIYSVPEELRPLVLNEYRGLSYNKNELDLFAWLYYRFEDMQTSAEILENRMFSNNKNVSFKRFLELATKQDIIDFLNSSNYTNAYDVDFLIDIVQKRNIDLSSITECLSFEKFTIEEKFKILELEKDEAKRKEILIKSIHIFSTLDKEFDFLQEKVKERCN